MMPPHQVSAYVMMPMTKLKMTSNSLPVVWRNVIIFGILHVIAMFGAQIAFFQIPVGLWLFGLFYGLLSGLGVTAGAHRLWSHRTYKAKWSLRLFLALCNCIAGQNDIYEWSRDHRVHHKFSETNADPHNVNRGFFFAHMGWLLRKKHQDVIKKGKTIDCSDILRDPVVQFQRRYYVPLVVTFSFVVPTVIPPLCWGETYYRSFLMVAIFRYVVSLHFTWLVNSAAHLWGNRPYDKYIGPRENFFVSWNALGEGFHNYHHTFPWDYSTSELGWTLNITTVFIDVMAWLGLAYDRRRAQEGHIKKRKEQTGDSTTIF